MLKFSLILCTMNRPQLLERCLDSIMAQEYKGYEVIVVDQSNEFNERVSERVDEYVHIEKKGLSNARNVALDYVSGEYCCLVDDDAVYPPEWLKKLVKSIKDNNPDVLCGRTKDPETGEYGLYGRNESIVFPLNYWEVQKYGISPCCCFKTSYLIKIGFDDNLGVGRRWGAGEETDAIWSIMEMGGRVKYDPSIIVLHPVQRDVLKLGMKKITLYNLGFGALYAKHVLKGKGHIRLLYFWSLFRSVVGIAVYTLKRDSVRKSIQKKSFLAKQRGYSEYFQRSAKEV